MAERDRYQILFGISAAVVVVGLLLDRLLRNSRGNRNDADASGFEQLVGKTPLVRLHALCKILDCEVYGKAEFMNPGGSIKDRVALEIAKSLAPNTIVYEGSSGSTGISLTLAAKARGHACVIFMPDDQAKEKRDLIKSLGGSVRLVRPMSIVDPNHMCKAAQKAAQEDPLGVYADQFENKLNFKVHYSKTALEILQQTNRKLNVFVASAGTGGTISGVSSRLKLELGDRKIKCLLADPQGSALASRINEGTLFNVKDREGHRVRHPIDTITEGIGLNRLTDNFQIGIPFIDHAFTITDAEAIKMSRFLLNTEGLFLGSSSAVNVACVVKARMAGIIQKGDVVVTILCDSGSRHVSKFWNDEFLKNLNLLPTSEECSNPLDFLKQN
jgi:cysteine synthase A